MKTSKREKETADHCHPTIRFVPLPCAETEIPRKKGKSLQDREPQPCQIRGREIIFTKEWSIAEEETARRKKTRSKSPVSALTRGEKKSPFRHGKMLGG